MKHHFEVYRGSLNPLITLCIHIITEVVGETRSGGIRLVRTLAVIQ